MYNNNKHVISMRKKISSWLYRLFPTERTTEEIIQQFHWVTMISSMQWCNVTDCMVQSRTFLSGFIFIGRNIKEDPWFWWSGISWISDLITDQVRISWPIAYSVHRHVNIVNLLLDFYLNNFRMGDCYFHKSGHLTWYLGYRMHPTFFNNKKKMYAMRASEQ